MPDKDKKYNDPWYEIEGAKRPDDPWYEVAGAKRPEKKETRSPWIPHTFQEAIEARLAQIQAKSPLVLPPGSPEYLVKRSMDLAGLGKIAAIAAVANMYAESKLDPKAKQKLTGGKIGRGRGLAQWETGGRWDTDTNNVLAYAKLRDVDPYGADVQIGFMGSEMDNTKQYGGVRDRMNKAKTVREATSIFLKDYEKAGVEHADVRFDYAEQLKKKIDAIPGF
tara:strand:+ start:229 stop:894 length:666 start_codon:yes stop_codon:yes gene_type:complete